MPEQTLKQFGPHPGQVLKLESQQFGPSIVVCIEVPHRETEARLQFAPLDVDGINGQTLYWDSVCDDTVVESFPHVRAYLLAEVPGPAPDARGRKPMIQPPAVAAPIPVPLAVVELPPARPLPAWCHCTPGTWPPPPFKVPVACGEFTEDTMEAGKCIVCEHLQECHKNG